MRKWTVFVVVWLGFITGTQATHIVGGEFELVHIDNNQFQLNLNLYFDVLNGNIGARDPSIEAAIYRKSDNSFITSYILPLVSESRVDYFQPECSNGEVITDKLIYTTNIVLAADIYNDPEGYYIAWERCCRNYTIDNVISNDPSIGIYAGQTFYLEFPPVVKDGEPFINSSPVLFPPLNDYACPFKPYWVDFQGTDPDGDSLAYSLITPLNTKTGNPVVDGGAGPAPYPEVQWAFGFGLDNIMFGAPDLSISDDGFLTVTPTFNGLYAFAVKVEEFRDGEKIGEIRRDFQLLVVDNCPQAEAPVIRGRTLGDTSFPFVDVMQVSFSAGTPDDQRCIEVQITDPDALKASDNFTENVSISAIPLGFRKEEEVKALLPDDIEATLMNGSSASFTICFDECPFFKDGSFRIGVVAFDDACTLPLTDTLEIEVFVEPPPNNSPFFTDGEQLNLTVTETAGGVLNRNVLARDIDNDSLTLTIQPVDFDPAEFGISLNPGSNNPGEVEALLDWNYDCQQFSFDGQTEFPFMLIVDDKDQCEFADGDTLDLNLNIILPPNTEPEVRISINPEDDDFHLQEQFINSTLSFDVNARDADNDQIILTAQGANFEFADLNITFPEVRGSGIPGVDQLFTWAIPCSPDLLELDTLKINFLAEDIDRCEITNRDTVSLDVVLQPSPSTPPVTNAFALNTTTLSGTAVDLVIGEESALRITGADAESDSLHLKLLNPNDFPDVSFPDAAGKGNVASIFSWQPDCSLLNGQDSVLVQGLFEVLDNNCLGAKGDTLILDFIVRDSENFEERFRAPNVITPNDDSLNDFFTLANIFDGSTGEERSMPEDNCAGRFEKIVIINRWGRPVYESSTREFRWRPVNEPTGVYYYSLVYSNRTYKGVISVLF